MRGRLPRVKPSTMFCKMRQALFKKSVLVFLQPELTGMRVDVFGDNKGAEAIADTLSSASGSKHIEVKLNLFSRVDSLEGSLCLARVNGGTTCRCPHEALGEKKVFYCTAEL